jgi:prolyl-tRNA synthetase
VKYEEKENKTIMRWTDTLIPTLREDPQEAEIMSHKLMVRAGLIRRLAGGLYTFLPLGLRSLRKVEQIVREEMDRAAAIEVHMPALCPRELWERTERLQAMGDTMFRLKDRQGRGLVLGPTHEEVITDLISREISSYRQMPKTFYQIQTKFRDEIRPRFGLMRSKEFLMKDAYSFDTDMNTADASYRAMYDAYVRIFARCGLRTKVVEADSGAMGGKWSHEFMVLADAGEDGLVECEACAYAANLERAERAITPSSSEAPVSQTAAEEVLTPDCRTIEQVSAFLKCSPSDLVKTIIYMIKGEPAAVLTPGDREVNEHKLVRLFETADVAMADEATIRKVTGAPVGFAGPVGLKIPIYADVSLQGRAGLVAGGNKADTHLRNVAMDKDFSVTSYYDLCVVREGDLCPKCRATLREKRGIEVGHVFKLGTKYSEKLEANFVAEDGQRKPCVMGCYGIGVSRTLQSVIEQSHDANGIIWPRAVAPYQVALLALNPEKPECMELCERIAADLAARGIDAIIDNRDERPGVKFKDADLVGFPLRVVVGERTLAKNCVELKARTAPKADFAPIPEAVEAIVRALA